MNDPIFAAIEAHRAAVVRSMASREFLLSAMESALSHDEGGWGEVDALGGAENDLMGFQRAAARAFITLASTECRPSTAAGLAAGLRYVAQTVEGMSPAVEDLQAVMLSFAAAAEALQAT